MQDPTFTVYFCLSDHVIGRLLGFLSILEASLYVGAILTPISPREERKLGEKCSLFKVMRPESSGPESWAQAA